MIELINVNKTFRQKNREVTALSNLTLKVSEGQIYGVIGTSGAGKSTLIRCVNLLEKPESGQVIVDGQNLVALKAAELTKARRQIGMIFQHFNLLSSRTVSENVAFPLELVKTPAETIKERVSKLLNIVGLSEKADDYPSNLSGGQKQRVAIARTLANNPKVLLCDEATSSLDPGTTASILELLKEINQRLNITILLITHEMSVVKAICDEVGVISDGRLIEQGTVNDIFSHPKTSIAKAFIASTLKIKIPDDYKLRLSSEPAPGKQMLLQLEFTGESINEPVISEVARSFNVDNNIICGQIDYTGGVKFGLMIMEVKGNESDVRRALSFYETKQIQTLILGYV